MTPTPPKEHGFLFQEEVMRALLDEWAPKTVTRRLPTATKFLVDGKGISAARWRSLGINLHRDARISVYGSCLRVPRDNAGTGAAEWITITSRVQPGDLIWAREAFAHIYRDNSIPEQRRADDICYRADQFSVDEYVYGR